MDAHLRRGEGGAGWRRGRCSLARPCLAALWLAVLVLASVGAVWADPIQPRSQSIYSDHVASEAGDTVVVLIKDVTTVVQHADTQSDRTGRTSLFGLATLLQRFFPSALDNSSRNGTRSNDDHQQRFESTLTTTVTSVTPTGNLLIEGRRVLNLNGQRQELRVSGEVRPMDLSSDNTIASNRISNLQIDYKGPLKGHDRKGLLQYVLDILY